MANVLVRDLDETVLDRLKKRAVRNRRSLQSEVQLILAHAADEHKPLSDLEVARRIRTSIKNRNQTDSVELLREDRAR
jgi:plasmid stability protein